MKFLFGLIAGVAIYWMQITLAPHLAVFGYKPNLLLITVLIFGLRWINPWLFVYAAVAGLAQDVYSHGLLGVYGLSFLAAAALANLTGKLIFEQNTLVIALIVVGLSIVEGMIALTLLNILSSDALWLSWFFGRVIPQALYHGALTPLFLFGLNRLERRLTGWVQPRR